jgi:hypothetical protein
MLQARRQSDEVPKKEGDEHDDEGRDHPRRFRAPLLEERFRRWRRNLRIGGCPTAAITDERLVGDLGSAETTLQYRHLTETEETGETGKTSHGGTGETEISLDLIIPVTTVSSV